MNPESEYLQEIETQLQEYTQHVEELDEADPEMLDKLVVLLAELKEAEDACRKKHKIGVRFSVLAAQIKELYDKQAAKLKEQHEELEASVAKSAAENAGSKNTTTLYVYLFNAQGMKATAWQHLLTLRALHDHSVNRPIYATKEAVEELMRSKSNPAQHAYIEVDVKNEDILMGAEASIFQDKLGHPLVRIKQGALKPNGIRLFHHKEIDYLLDNEGRLILKNANTNSNSI